MRSLASEWLVKIRRVRVPMAAGVLAIACAEGSSTGPSPILTQTVSVVSNTTLSYSATLRSVATATRTVYHDGVLVDSMTLTITSPFFFLQHVGMRKGNWRFVLKGDGADSSSVTADVPNYPPTAVAAFWEGLNVALSDGVTKTFDLTASFTDLNPEDLPVVISAAASTDGRTSVALVGNVLHVTPLSAPGPYQLQVDVGTPSGGTATRLIDGVITPSPPFSIRETDQDVIVGRPGIASDGTTFLVGWREATIVKVGRVSASGVPLDGAGTTVGTITGSPGGPSIAFDGTNYLVTWADQEIRAVRVSAAGALLDAVPVTLTTGADAKLRAPGVAWDGSRYLIAWRTNGDRIRTLRVGTDLAPLDSVAGREIGVGFYPWVAAGGGVFLVTWHFHGTSSLDIRGNRIDGASGAALDGTGFIVASGASRQDHSSVSFGAGQFFVVWNDTRTGAVGGNTGGAFGARVSAVGTVLDPNGIEIGPMARDQVPVQSLFDGTRFVVIWHADFDHLVFAQNVDVMMRRVTTAGVAEGVPLNLTPTVGTQWGPTAAMSTTHILIGWNESSGGRGTGVWGQLVRR